MKVLVRKWGKFLPDSVVEDDIEEVNNSDDFFGGGPIDETQEINQEGI